MKTCRLCKWWRGSDDRPAVCDLITHNEETKGWKGPPNMAYIDVQVTADDDSGMMIDQRFITAADFGCALHEERPPQ